jgi:hypothetical protein
MSNLEGLCESCAKYYYPDAMPAVPEVDTTAEAYTRGVADERARCLWLIQRQRLKAFAARESIAAGHLRVVEIHVEGGTVRKVDTPGGT